MGNQELVKSFYLDALTLKEVEACDLPRVRDICGWLSKVCFLTKTNEIIIFDVANLRVAEKGCVFSNNFAQIRCCNIKPEGPKFFVGGDSGLKK